MVRHLYLLFQLVSSFKKCPFGFETAHFNCAVWYGFQSAKISVRRHTSKSYAETTLHPFIVKYKAFKHTQSNVFKYQKSVKCLRYKVTK